MRARICVRKDGINFKCDLFSHLIKPNLNLYKLILYHVCVLSEDMEITGLNMDIGNPFRTPSPSAQGNMLVYIPFSSG